MLVTEEIDIGEAAFRVGYSRPSQFRMDYRRFFGETPSKDLNAIRLLGGCGNPSLYVSG
jgi:AraC-like DNA-binding protein